MFLANVFDLYVTMYWKIKNNNSPYKNRPTEKSLDTLPGLSSSVYSIIDNHGRTCGSSIVFRATPLSVRKLNFYGRLLQFLWFPFCLLVTFVVFNKKHLHNGFGQKLFNSKWIPQSLCVFFTISTGLINIDFEFSTGNYYFLN